MRDVLAGMLDGLSRGPVALARIISTSGPTPRGVGAAMVLTADGEVIGSISGGCVESALVHTCTAVLDDGEAVVEHFGIADADGIEVGLTCGGTLDVFVERVDALRRPAVQQLVGHLAADRRVAWATTLAAAPEWHFVTSPTSPPWRRLDRDVADLLASGRSGIIGVDDCDEPPGEPFEGSRPRTFVHTFAAPPRLILVGANDFVRATCGIGRALGYRVTVVDARPVFATRARFPDADEIVVDWPHRYLESEIRSGAVDATTAVCVMTHDPKFDVPTLRVALAGADVGFVGALGSRRTVTDRNSRLVESGVTAAQLARLRSPLGLDLGGHTPAEVAVSIAAQLIAERHDASTRALHTTSDPLHR